MPRYDACPAHTEVDLYTGCTLGCTYCIAGQRHAPVTRPVDLEAILAGIRVASPEAAPPYYVSPWTDAYQHLERETGHARRVLGALADRGLPFFVITRSCLVERDVDLIAGRENAFVAISLNTLVGEITRRLEPGAPSADERCDLLRRMMARGARTVVKVDPIIPGVTDGDRLERLLGWLCELRPHAVTLETLRLSSAVFARLGPALTRAERRALRARYPETRTEPSHPSMAYRTGLFARAASRLAAAGIRACFCKATLPEPITAHDCRGGYG